MDPAFMDKPLWDGIASMLSYLWLYLLFIIGAAFNFLIAHAVIPSLVATGQLPNRMARLRPLFYLGALGILGIALVFLVLTAMNAGVLGDIWPRWWI